MRRSGDQTTRNGWSERSSDRLVNNRRRRARGVEFHYLLGDYRL